VSTTPSDFSVGIVGGIRDLLQALGISPASIEFVNHGTTIASNAILENKGAKVALVTTRGFRDVLELRRLRRPTLYDLGWRPPAPLVPRNLRLEIFERMGPDGAVKVPLTETELQECAEAIKACDVEAVAVCLLHSYANPSHEHRVAEHLRATLPATTYITCSSDIVREAREYERTSTVAVNAFIGPGVHRYVDALSRGLQSIGIRAPVRLMQSNGALLEASRVAARAASIIESGPAAGVIGAARVAAEAGLEQVIAFDMGGTTAKAALVEGAQPAMTLDYEVGAGINLSSKLAIGGGYAVRLPFVDLSEIGAGGGSHVLFDDAGHLHVGPESCGADPGPACYGRGGQTPALTDAFLALGYLNSESLAGGDLTLRPQAALDALEPIARRFNSSLHETCYGVFQLAASTMVRAVKAVTTFRGRDPREFTLIAYGGNGPMVAAAIASSLEIPKFLVPPNPGVFSAMGLLMSTTGQEIVRAFRRRLSSLDPSELESAFEAAQSEALIELADNGLDQERTAVLRRADLRYCGQAYELSVPVELGADPSDLAAAFTKEYERTYGHQSTDEIEMISLRVFVAKKPQVIDQRAVQTSAAASRASGAKAQKTRSAYFGPAFGFMQTPIVQRSALSTRFSAGPLIIEEYDSTILVPPKCEAALDEHGNVVVDMTKSISESAA
jgi:N-methylhydantoinase A